MLTKEEFANEVREGLLEHIQGDFAGDAHIEIVEVTKNNDQVLTGAVVKSAAMPVVPTIYFDREYENYKSGKPMEMILSEMGEAYSDAIANAPKFNIDMMDKNGIMNRIVCSVLNMSENRNRLKELMYTPLGNDLALMYLVRIDDEARAPISKRYAEELGVSLAELNTVAMENTPRYYPPVMRSLTDVAIGMGYPKNFFEERHEQGLDKDFYVLSNDEAVFGATTLFYPEMKELLGEMLGGNFYVYQVHSTTFCRFQKHWNLLFLLLLSHFLWSIQEQMSTCELKNKEQNEEPLGANKRILWSKKRQKRC